MPKKVNLGVRFNEPVHSKASESQAFQVEIFKIFILGFHYKFF